MSRPANGAARPKRSPGHNANSGQSAGRQILFLICSRDADSLRGMPVESNGGRGATRNATSTRFNLKERVTEGDWLDQVEALDGVVKRRTTCHHRTSQIDPDSQ